MTLAAAPCVAGVGHLRRQRRGATAGVWGTSSSRSIAARPSRRRHEGDNDDHRSPRHLVSVHALATRDGDDVHGAEAAASLSNVGSNLRRRCTGAALALATGVVMLAPPPMSSSPSIVAGDNPLGGDGGGRWSALTVELASPAAAAGIELPDQLDPWKDGRARKARERVIAQQRVDAVYQVREDYFILLFFWEEEDA